MGGQRDGGLVECGHHQHLADQPLEQGAHRVAAGDMVHQAVARDGGDGRAIEIGNQQARRTGFFVGEGIQDRHGRYGIAHDHRVKPGTQG